jgi:F-type H+-transporting ATPase subunit alpha
VDRVPEFLDGLTQRVKAEAAPTLARIAEGDWSDETQAALDKAVKGFADDFGYDLDEEGQPLAGTGVGETSRMDEGLAEAAGEEDAAAANQAEEEEAAATA